MNGMLIIPTKNHSFSENIVIWKASVQFGEKILKSGMAEPKNRVDQVLTDLPIISQ